MSAKQVEEKMTELIHRDPFVPFVVEMIDGQSLDIFHPGVAFDDSGAVFIGHDGGLVEFEFENVRHIRLHSAETVA